MKIRRIGQPAYPHPAKGWLVGLALGGGWLMGCAATPEQIRDYQESLPEDDHLEFEVPPIIFDD